MLEAKVQMEVRVVSSGAEVGAPMEGQEPLISPAILPVALQAPGGTEYSMPVVIAVIAKRFLRTENVGTKLSPSFMRQRHLIYR